MKVRAFRGRQNGGPVRTYVALTEGAGLDYDWMTPAQARNLADRLRKVADKAEALAFSGGKPKGKRAAKAKPPEPVA